MGTCTIKHTKMMLILPVTTKWRGWYYSRFHQQGQTVCKQFIICSITEEIRSKRSLSSQVNIFLVDSFFTSQRGRFAGSFVSSINWCLGVQMGSLFFLFSPDCSDYRRECLHHQTVSALIVSCFRWASQCFLPAVWFALFGGFAC